MPIEDQEFVQRLRATFKVEAEEHLQAMASMLLELEQSAPSAAPRATIENIFREAHSLKGAARAVDLSEIEAVCQAIESVFSSWKREQTSPTPQSLDTIHQALDSIHALIGEPPAGSSNSLAVSHELISRLGQLQLSPSSAAPRPVATPAPPAAVAESSPISSAIAPAAAEPEKTAVQTVRISIDKLDARLFQAEDMLSVKAMATQRAAELRELMARFEQWRKEWAKISAEAANLRHTRQSPGISRAGAQSSSSALVDFLNWNLDYIRSLETTLLSMSTRAQRDRHMVAKRVDDLLEDSKKLLMLPFSTISGIFPKLVRDLCRDQNKEAEIVIHGGDVEIDKRILEEMKDALIHILRNCVDHGVETPAQRANLQKSARATIEIAVSPVNGSKVEIRVSDDGAGVDLERVKESALHHGIVSQADMSLLTQSQTLSLVFHSEVSASPTVTAISGRGLGMAIVRAKIEKLGGQVSIESKRHSGTTLSILLPLTLATFRGILVSVADRLFIVPTSGVERVLRIKPSEIQTVENRESIQLQGRAISLVRLAAVLDLPAGSRRDNPSAPLSVVVLRWTDQRIAFVVDDVLREEEVLVKPLRKPLVRVQNIAGATVLGSGKPAPILNVTDLMKSAQSRGGEAPQPAAQSTPRTSIKHILVAEDSITSRMLLKGILESAGYQVRTAVDGVDAFTILRENQFDLVVSDVEMPRMNGFDLAGRIRADKRLGDLPVILVTALESQQERERGIDAGASAYIIKSNFDQSNLLEAIRRLI